MMLHLDGCDLYHELYNFNLTIPLLVLMLYTYGPMLYNVLKKKKRKVYLYGLVVCYK